MLSTATIVRLTVLAASTIGLLPAASLTFSVFTTPPAGVSSNGTIGFTYAGDMFVGSVYHSGLNSLYSTDLSGGSQQVFAPTVSIPGGNPEEHFVASSLGLAGFPSRDIYVGINGGIVHISHDGLTSNTFVSGLSGEVRGILFDSIGSFGNDMLVTTSTGAIYRINSAGVASLLANVGADTEGLDVAPLSFGLDPGSLFVVSEGTGQIHAISTGGAVSVVATVASAEMIHFIPNSFSGDPVEGFYGANYTPNVVKADSSQFSSLMGDIMVTGEGTHQVTGLHWNGSSLDASNIGTFPNQPEDGVFVTTAIVNPNPTPEPATGLLVAAGIGVAAFVRRRMRGNRR